jgi:osmotically inducible lipoprotein OsmB
MRKMRWLALLLLAGVGCSSMNNTEKDGLMGAGAGAATGAVLTRGNPVGAVIGGLFGGLVGASIGSDQDRHDDRNKAIVQAQANAAANAARNQMSLQEIVQMAQTGVSDAVIIRQMDSTGSVFALTSVDIQYLHDQRVSDQVISAMLARRYPRGGVVVGPGPVYAGPPPGTVVIVDPGPPPPPIGVGFGIGYGRRW